MSDPARTDVLIAGGGLAAGLLAIAIRQRRPGTRVTLVEGGERLGGHHLWSFFASDIAEPDLAIVAPLIGHRWDGYRVAFPGLARSIDTPYHTIASERLDAMLRGIMLPEDLLTGRRIRALDRGNAFLADGTTIQADTVIDARGFADDGALDLGWQKFVGQLLRLDRPHGIDRPLIMDATVDQSDGYRFLYLLPFDATRLFVEDTYYSETADLNVGLIGARIAEAAALRGWSIAAVEREEAAALPIAMGGNFELLWRTGAQGIGKIGMAAALFHPMTGYSLPDAVRTAALVAGLKPLNTDTAHAALKQHAAQAWRERGFYRLLARLMFRAARPPERYRMLEHFYRRSPALIGRFYAARSTRADKARILCGKPPVPIGKALRVIAEGEA